MIVSDRNFFQLVIHVLYDSMFLPCNMKNHNENMKNHNGGGFCLALGGSCPKSNLFEFPANSKEREEEHRIP